MCWACWRTCRQHPLDLGQGHEGLPEPSCGGVPGSPSPSRGSIEPRARPLTAASRLALALSAVSSLALTLSRRRQGSPSPCYGGVKACPRPLAAVSSLALALLRWHRGSHLLSHGGVPGSGEPFCGGCRHLEPAPHLAFLPRAPMPRPLQWWFFQPH